MPDLESRRGILAATLRKSPVSKEVDLDYLARHTDKFTGADLTEVCQRAAKFAIRESIEKGIEREEALAKLRAEGEEEEDLMDDDFEDPVPEINPKHFEMAMRDARRSVSDADLMKYSRFARTLHQQRSALGTGVANFRFPERQAGAQADANAEDDDL